MFGADKGGQTYRAEKRSVRRARAPVVVTTGLYKIKETASEIAVWISFAS